MTPTQPPCQPVRIMLSEVAGILTAASSVRVEIIALPPLVKEPTAVVCVRIGDDDKPAEMWDGKEWKLPPEL